MRQLSKFSLLSLTASLFIALSSTGCSSDEPGGGDDNGEQTVTEKDPIHTDIKTARALILYTGDGDDNTSRASERDFGPSGLYQFDADGKVSPVAITCVNNTNSGSTDQQQQQLTVSPFTVQALSKNYTALYSCTYYDEAGNEVSGVTASNLLIHNPSGNIYNIDFLLQQSYLYDNNSVAYEESDGSLLLYYAGSGFINRLTFSGKTVECTRLHNDECGIPDAFESVLKKSSTGLIFNTQPGLGEDMAVLFPNGNIDYLANYEIPDISNAITENFPSRYPYTGYIWWGDGPAVIRQQYYSGYDYVANHSFTESFLTIFKINVGNNGGKLTFTQGTTRHFIESEIIEPHSVCAVGDNLVIERYDQNYLPTPTYLVYNSSSKTWREVDKNFAPAYTRFLQPDASFDGRAWIVDMPWDGDQSNSKIWWINPSTLQTGSLSLNLAGKHIAIIEGHYQDGYVIFKGDMPAAEKYCAVIFNLATGKSETITVPYSSYIDVIMLN